jgi:hypothetical protein
MASLPAEIVVKSIQSQAEFPDHILTETLTLIPHAAYHLGTIRQMIERIKGHA